jgi:uncharacterized phage protein (TIGR01671 family)
MREIKFRAWDKKISRFHYWSSIIQKHDNIFWAMAKNNEMPITEFTSLKDKNGKDIYEGDIIKSESNIIRISDNKPTGKTSICYFRIGWHKSGCWNKFDGLSDDHTGITGITISVLQYYEIIGNIHQNPELLNQ